MNIILCIFINYCFSFFFSIEYNYLFQGIKKSLFFPYGLCVIHLIWSVAYCVLTIGILKATLKKKILYFFDKTIDKSLHANSINAIWPPPPPPHFIFNLLQTSMSVKVLHVSMGIVLTMSTCTPVSVNLALHVSTVIQLCFF